MLIRVISRLILFLECYSFAVAVALQLVAFWSAWRVLAVRFANSTEELWGLLALVTVVALLIMPRGNSHYRSKRDASWNVKYDAERARWRTGERPPLVLAACFALAYCAAYLFAPPLVRVAIALVAIGCTLGTWRYESRLHLPTLGLLLLSLPIIPSLQFYGGYPLRVFVATVTAPLLRLSGFAVVAEGTCLRLHEILVWVDAPCSGVRMLWTGFYLFLVLASLYGLRSWQTLCGGASAFAAIMLGNVFRATALFYVEAKIIHAPAWTHEAVGVCTFVVVACCITAAVKWLAQGKIEVDARAERFVRCAAVETSL